MATPITIKRYNSSSWDTLHPITEGQNVYGSGTKATTSLLDSNNKLARDFLQLYEHNLFVFHSSYGAISISLITTSSDTINTYGKLATALYNAGFTATDMSNGTSGFRTASGYWSESTSYTRITQGLYATSTTVIKYRYITIASYSSSTTTIPTTSMSSYYGNATMSSSNVTVQDYVRTL